jgi:hypothetical protein
MIRCAHTQPTSLYMRTSRRTADLAGRGGARMHASSSTASQSALCRDSFSTAHLLPASLHLYIYMCVRRRRGRHHLPITTGATNREQAGIQQPQQTAQQQGEKKRGDEHGEVHQVRDGRRRRRRQDLHAHLLHQQHLPHGQ